MKYKLIVFVFLFSQGSPFQTLAAQRFTIICINLQMWRSSGFEVAEFAFLLDSYVNVSKWFRRRRDAPSSSFDLQIDTDTVSLYKGWVRQSKMQRWYNLSSQTAMNRFCCYLPLRAAWGGIIVWWTWGEALLFTLRHRPTVHMFCLVLQMSVCVAKTSLCPRCEQGTGWCRRLLKQHKQEHRCRW